MAAAGGAVKRLLAIVFIGFVGWQAHGAWNRATLASQEPEPTVAPYSEEAPRAPEPARAFTTSADSRYQCDGRTHCSQMRSCEEATWFINHCPGTEMDGNHDGVPCERQWCGH